MDPAWKRIETYLRQLLPSVPVGQPLPTIMELCEKFQVKGVQTVRSAYEPLIAEGLVEVQQAPRRRWIVRAHPRSTGPTLQDVRDELAVARVALDRAVLAVDELSKRS